MEIASKYGCNRQTITNYLKKYDIPLKTKAQAQIRYTNRQSFNGSLEEKAYLIGFRLGDLNVYKPSKYSETVVIRCHTTSFAQVILIKELFSKYGRVKTARGKYGYTINCFVDLSFDFLLHKQDSIEEWITLSPSTSLAFMAGYIDAEGTFQINQGRARFALSTCDKNILYWIHTFLISLGIKSIYKKINNKGDKSIGKYLFNFDVWRVNVNDSISISKLIFLIGPLLRHKKRLDDLGKAKYNIETRKTKAKIYESKYN